jgi:hypothetical protein
MGFGGGTAFSVNRCALVNTFLICFGHNRTLGDVQDEPFFFGDVFAGESIPGAARLPSRARNHMKTTIVSKPADPRRVGVALSLEP